MSKTTPEEARQLAIKHLEGIWSGRQMTQLADLIDEVRGVDAEPVAQTEYCWLVELFEGSNGNSAGLYHTGFVDIGGYSRTTRKPHEARKYIKEQATAIAAQLGTTLTGTWRAVEHGFDTHPAPSQPSAPVELPVVAWALTFDGVLHERWVTTSSKSAAEGMRDNYTDMTPPRDLPDLGIVELVKLSDAQAAIDEHLKDKVALGMRIEELEAGRKAS